MTFFTRQNHGRGDLGARVWRPNAPLLWWSPPPYTGASALPIVGAYRAIATPGSPWPFAPTSYAESRQDWSGNQPLLAEGNGAVPWAALTGWGFIAGLAQWLDTGLIPANDQSWSMVIQFAGVTNTGILAGMQDAADRRFFVRPDDGLGNIRYCNGDSVIQPPPLLTGNLGVSGDQGYRNGVADGGLMGAWTAPAVSTIYVGARNFGGVTNRFMAGNIESIAIYSAALAPPQLAAVVAAQGAL